MTKISLRLPVALALALLTLPLAAGPAVAAEDPEQSALFDTVRSAYVQGIHIDRDPEAIRAGFHQGFVMFIAGDDGGVRQVTRDGWIERIEQGNAENPDRPKADVDSRMALLERTGKAAVVKVEIDRDGKHVYTDYMSMYKFDDGWKIVGKIFESHD